MISKKQTPATTGDVKKTTIGVVFAAVLSLATLGVSIAGLVVAHQTAQHASASVREEAALDRRVDAYSAYFGEQARFNEFLWDTSSWAGDGVTQASAEFWAEAREARRLLETTYWEAELVTDDEASLETLQTLHAQTDRTWVEFKCFTELSLESDCTGIAFGERDRVRPLLDNLAAVRLESQRSLSGDVQGQIP